MIPLICLFCLINFSDAFQVQQPVSFLRVRTTPSFGTPVASFSSIRPTDNDASKEEKASSMSFDEADVKLKDEDEQKRLESQGNSLSDEEIDGFEGREEQFDAMRALVRKSATELGVEKSIATQQAIREATMRAMNKDFTPELDTTAFLSPDLNEDEMSEDEKKLIDEMKAMSLLDMAKDEFSKVKLPDFMATIRLGVFMALLFAATSNGIWNLESFIRTKYNEVSLIPSKPTDFSMFYENTHISFTDEEYEKKFNELPWWRAPEWYEGKIGKKPFLGGDLEKWGTYDKVEAEARRSAASAFKSDVPQDI